MPRRVLDDNEVDRLHCKYTVFIHCFLAAIVGAFYLIGDPIRCWTPANFADSWDKYVTDYCFIENTYFLPSNENIPLRLRERSDREIKYYQWVPFVLALMALLFYIPRMVWTTLNRQSGINVQKIISMSMDSKLNSVERLNNVKKVAQHIRQSVDLQLDFAAGRNRQTWGLQCRKLGGIYVTVLYLVVKTMYLINVIGQFFLLNRFLGPEYNWWGFGILRDIVNDVEWQHSGHFPRTTLCDFEVRELGKTLRWTVQCVIWINTLNEKIFLFLWWWFLIIAIITAIDLIHWTVKFILGAKVDRSFVLRYLNANPNFAAQTPQKFEKNERQAKIFIGKCLRPDGVFMLRLISLNCGDLVTMEIIWEMWKSYLNAAHKVNGSIGTDTETENSSASKASDMLWEIEEFPLIYRSASRKYNHALFNSEA